MKTRTVLTPQAAMQIKALYAETDAVGRKRYSQLQIAKMLGVGETTVYRCIRSAGGYSQLPEQAPGDSDAEASMARFAQAHPELLPADALPEGALAKMNAAIQAEKEKPAEVERMLREIQDPLDEPAEPEKGAGK